MCRRKGVRGHLLIYMWVGVCKLLYYVRMYVPIPRWCAMLRLLFTSFCHSRIANLILHLFYKFN